MSDLVYLACPYTHDDHQVMIDRFHAVNRVAARLMSEGLLIISPISHTHPIAESGDLPRGWDYWGKYDFEILSRCSRLIVLKLPGWEQSRGVRSEIRIAERLGLIIEYLEGE